MSIAPTIREDGRRWSAAGPGYVVRVLRPEDGEIVIARCDVEDSADLRAAAAAVLALLPDGGLIVSWERPDRAPLNAALLAAGCTVRGRKQFVEMELTGALPRGGRFSWRTLAETGQPEFLRLMLEASDGDPYEEGPRDPQREWDELVEHAGDAFDPALWRVALIDDASIGIVLPTVWPGDDPRGTLSYVGVLPAHRGHGHGRALHASGLRLLAEAGARRYAGSTDVRNAAMTRVFAANGCTLKGVQLLLHPPGMERT